MKYFAALILFLVCLEAQAEYTIVLVDYKAPNLQYVVNAKTTLSEALDLSTNTTPSLSYWIQLYTAFYNARWSAVSGTDANVVPSASSTVYIKLAVSHVDTVAEAGIAAATVEASSTVGTTTAKPSSSTSYWYIFN